MGQRIAKHVLNNQTGVLEKSTYYTLDAQGNTLSVYEHEVNNSDVLFSLKENHIFGSSRLGMLNQNVNMYSTNNSSNVSSILGNKSYELVSHLGNVLNVITDRKLGIDSDNNGTVDFYTADVVSYSDYSPFGSVMDGRHGSVGQGSRYGYQGSECDPEIKGEGNSYTTFFRELDPRIGRWLSIDPEASSMPWQSPYCSMDNNPILYNDVLGNKVNGDYYDAKGKHLGSDGKNDKIVYVADNVTKNEKGLVTSATGSNKLKINHDEFQKQAATVYGESSAYKMSSVTEDLKKEMYAIAYVHLNNKTAYGASSDKAKEFLNLTPDGRNSSEFKKLANAAIINAQTGGFDYSYGANMWDGKEQSLFPASDNRGSTGKYELHMNTMGWSISDEHYKTWKKNVGDGFKAPQKKAAPINYGNYTNKGKIRLQSTAVYGETIFWKMQ